MDLVKYKALMDSILNPVKTGRTYVKKDNTEFKKYRYEVHKHSLINGKGLPNFNNRSYNTYNLDHIVPIKYGFDNKIPIELMSSRQNIRVILWSDNRAKWHNLTKDALILLKKWGYEISENKKKKTNTR